MKSKKDFINLICFAIFVCLGEDFYLKPGVTNYRLSDAFGVQHVLNIRRVYIKISILGSSQKIRRSGNSAYIPMS